MLCVVYNLKKNFQLWKDLNHVQKQKKTLQRNLNYGIEKLAWFPTNTLVSITTEIYSRKKGDEETTRDGEGDALISSFLKIISPFPRTL